MDTPLSSFIISVRQRIPHQVCIPQSDLPNQKTPIILYFMISSWRIHHGLSNFQHTLSDSVFNSRSLARCWVWRNERTELPVLKQAMSTWYKAVVLTAGWREGHMRQRLRKSNQQNLAIDWKWKISNIEEFTFILSVLNTNLNFYNV